MDKMHWKEPSIANKKQERESLKTIAFPSPVPSVTFFQRKYMTSIGHARFVCVQNRSQHPPALSTPAMACLSHHQHYTIAPFSQPNLLDGSLNDMLLPHQHMHAKLLDDLLYSEQNEVQQLSPVAQFYSAKVPFSHAVSARDDIDQLVAAMSQSHEDANNAKMVSSLVPVNVIGPTPTLTRRPRRPMRKGTASYREKHIHTERQRRQDMTCLFSRLKSVLPSMQHDDFKGDRCTLLEHVIDYVRELDKKVQVLGKIKAELMQNEDGSFNNHQQQQFSQQATLTFVDSISVRPWGHVDIFITLSCPKHRGVWPNLLALLQDTLHLDVQNIALSSTPLFSVHSIYATVMEDVNEEVCFKLKDTLREFVTNHAYFNHPRC